MRFLLVLVLLATTADAFRRRVLRTIVEVRNTGVSP